MTSPLRDAINLHLLVLTGETQAVEMQCAQNRAKNQIYVKILSCALLLPESYPNKELLQVLYFYL